MDGLIVKAFSEGMFTISVLKDGIQSQNWRERTFPRFSPNSFVASILDIQVEALLYLISFYLALLTYFNWKVLLLFYGMNLKFMDWPKSVFYFTTGLQKNTKSI